LAAPTGNDLIAAERSVGVLAQSDWVSAEIPLSALLEESPDSQPPVCRDGGPHPTCWPNGT
jgi:hypothetical protein